MAGGRKKEFNEKNALEAAMNVFWSKGYGGASLSDLTTAMGINKPSMYSTFGNKEDLFLKTTRLYIESKAKVHRTLLNAPGTPLIDRIRNYMLSVVAMQCESVNPKGCYITLCQSEIRGGEMPEEAAGLLSDAGASDLGLLTDLFLSDTESRSLGLDKKADTNALCLITTLRGTAFMARLGTSAAELEDVIDSSLRGIGLLKEIK